MNRSVWSKVIGIDALMLCFSISVSIVGQMLSPIGEEYSLNLFQQSWLISSQSIGGIFFALLALFYSEMNKEKFVLISGAILGIMFLLIGIGIPAFLLFAAFALIGYSGSTLNSLTNSVISDTVPPEKADRFFSLLHMIFSIGAVITPLLSQYLYDKNGLDGVFLIFSAFIIASVIYYFVVFRKMASIKPAKRNLSIKQRVVESISLFKKPNMIIVFLLAIFASSAQLCMTYFISSYFSEIGSGGDFGALALSVFFLSMMVSRLIYSRIAGRFPKGAVISATNLTALLCWAAMLLVPGAAVKLVFMILGIFFFANTMPLIFASAIDTAPHSKASATGTVVLGYYIALLGFIPIAGSVGETYGLASGLASALPLVIASSSMGFVLYKKTKMI